VCLDIDECETGLADCFEPAHCENEAPGYSCSCKDGWTGDGYMCIGTVVVVVVVVVAAAVAAATGADHPPPGPHDRRSTRVTGPYHGVSGP